MLFGLVGTPINRSWSEILFNRIFNVEENDNLYISNNVSESSFERFMNLSSRYFEGLNVTIPYKESVLRYCTNKDPLVWKCGVANVLKREGGGFTAFNTDYFGLEHLFRNNSISGNGKRIAIAGTGGVSKTLIYFLLTSYNMELLHIYTRNRTMTEKTYSGTWQFEDIKIKEYGTPEPYDMLINCTPLGMNVTDHSPFSEGYFGEGAIAVDLTYQNECTEFMNNALGAHGRGINGRDMFFAQAEESYRIFFDNPPDEKMFAGIRKEVMKWITKG
jgi:Shikimate 5-dehydrogenase